MRTRIASVTAFVLFLLLALGAPGFPSAAGAAEKPIVLRSVCAWPPENIVCALGKKGFIDEVNRRGAGKVKIEAIGGPEVISPFDLIPALENGSFDVAISTGQYYSGTYKLSDVTSWIDPGKAEELAKDKRALKFVRDYFRQKTGIEILGFADVGTLMYVYTSKRPIHTLADFKGLKLRAGAPNQGTYIRGLGAASVQIAANELLTGLERGVVDGAYRGIHQVTQFGEAPYYKYVLDEPMAIADGFIYVAAPTWKKLPEDVRTLFDEVAAEWQQKVWQESTRLNKESLKVQEEKYHIEFTKPSPGIRAKVKELRHQIFSTYTSDPQYGSEIQSIFGKYYQ